MELRPAGICAGGTDTAHNLCEPRRRRETSYVDKTWREQLTIILGILLATQEFDQHHIHDRLS